MKRILFLFLMLLAFANGNSQILDPVKWKTKVEKISDTEFNLVFEASIQEGWHLYSQFTPDGGPLPVEFAFKDAKGNFKVLGKAKEGATHRRFNSEFGVDELYFEKKAVFKQKVKITNLKLKAISATVDYQTCKDVCINLNKKFKFTLPEIAGATTEKEDPKAVAAAAAKVKSKKVDAKTEVATTTVDTATTEVEADTSATETPVKDEEKGLFSIFFIAFLSGFAALLTPCVFPMIPMTVSFFTKQSKTRAQGIKNAIFYGFSIIFIYVLLGFLVTWIFGAGALNALSTNVWFNVIFFLMLVFFASSFLGAFEIMLPNSWANKVDSQADRGGIIGILFMALALAIVSFSCTGPIVGTLLVQAASKGGIAPLVGMLGFSLALALPFMLFAMFPGWLNGLPKSGGWLNTVKVFLGFLELALAFKFLSNADLVLQLHLLEREVFIAIWIAIFGALAFYLYGQITLPHDSHVPMHHISVGRLMMAMLITTFTIYLIPGLWGAPLKLISAFPPPMEYSESPHGVGGSSEGGSKSTAALPEGAKLGPHDIVVFEDYDKGLAYAKSVNKPIMLDFTGHACVNCRKMESGAWSEEAVLKMLKDEVVVISLFVDDKRELPKAEQTVSKVSGEIMTSVGDKWTDFMISKYKTNTQPLYVVTDLEGNNLNKKVPTNSYTTDVKGYENWLKTGISNFKK